MDRRYGNASITFRIDYKRIAEEKYHEMDTVRSESTGCS